VTYDWTLESVLRDWRPGKSWRGSFSEAFALVKKERSLEEQLRGWRTAALIFGDTHACELCLFVCCHASSIFPARRQDFAGHIDLCLMEIGFADAGGAALIPIVDIGKPGTMRRDEAAVSRWMNRELGRFGGDLGRAAEFSMRLAAIRFGLLSGPADPTLDQVLDPTLWRQSRD